MSKITVVKCDECKGEKLTGGYYISLQVSHMDAHRFDVLDFCSAECAIKRLEKEVK